MMSKKELISYLIICLVLLVVTTLWSSGPFAKDSPRIRGKVVKGDGVKGTVMVKWCPKKKSCEYVHADSDGDFYFPNCKKGDADFTVMINGKPYHTSFYIVSGCPEKGFMLPVIKISKTK